MSDWSRIKTRASDYKIISVMLWILSILMKQAKLLPNTDLRIDPYLLIFSDANWRRYKKRSKRVRCSSETKKENVTDNCKIM